MKKGLLVVSVLLFFNCNTTKTNLQYKRTYTELDSVSIADQFRDFSIDIPKDWFGYIESHNQLAISPREFLEGTKANKFYALSSVSFVVREISQKDCNCKTIDDVLVYSLSNFKKHSPKIKYKVIESSHSFYGKIYIVSYNWKQYSNSTVSAATIIIKHKEKQYTLNFSSLLEYYERYVKQSAKMIESFRIKDAIKK